MLHQPVPKILPDSPMQSPGQLMCGHLNLYIAPLFAVVVPVLGGHEKGFYCAVPFEVHLDPQAVPGPFELLPRFFWCRVPL